MQVFLRDAGPLSVTETHLAALRLGAQREVPLPAFVIAHRVGGVEDQVQQDLLQLHAAALEEGQRGRPDRC